MLNAINKSFTEVILGIANFQTSSVARACLSHSKQEKTSLMNETTMTDTGGSV